MASQTDKGQAVRVILKNGLEVTVTGSLGDWISYLAENNLFFSNPKTTGNFVFMLKGGDIQFKQDVTVQA